MPIHFSIGFVLEQELKRPIVAVCASIVDNVRVNARCVNVIQIKAHWPRGVSCK